MLPDKKITDKFNSFAGREVAVIETPHKTKYGTIMSYAVAPTDTTVADFRKAVEAAGLSLRLFLPNEMGTCDFRTNRFNATVEKEADGKFRIQKDFRIG